MKAAVLVGERGVVGGETKVTTRERAMCWRQLKKKGVAVDSATRAAAAAACIVVTACAAAAASDTKTLAGHHRSRQIQF